MLMERIIEFIGPVWAKAGADLDFALAKRFYVQVKDDPSPQRAQDNEPTPSTNTNLKFKGLIRIAKPVNNN